MVFAPAPEVAAQVGNVLVDYGADPDSRNQDGMSLSAAASAEAVGCIQVAEGMARLWSRTQGSPANRIGPILWWVLGREFVSERGKG